MERAVHEGRILVVDDEEMVRLFIAELLISAGFQAIQAEDADEAIYVAKQSPPSLILSDVSLRGMDGVALCRHLKGDPETSSIPVILISGNLIDNQDQVHGLMNGADDYILKPLDGKLLIAKIRAVLHRYIHPPEVIDCIIAGDLVVDSSAWQVTWKGNPIHLTRKEFDLLVTLLKKTGKVLHPSFLLKSVWGQSNGGDDFRTVRVHISSLRGKLGPFGDRIINIPGVGYKLDSP